MTVMVIQTEYGNEDDAPLKTLIKRHVLRTELPSLTEIFFQQEQYRWGRMYSLVGKSRTLLRQF